jgi:hypothetical protein
MLSTFKLGPFLIGARMVIFGQAIEALGEGEEPAASGDKPGDGVVPVNVGHEEVYPPCAGPRP